MKQHLWDLKKDSVFLFEDRPNEPMRFLGMDGMYAKAQALDPKLNKELCAQYDARSDFFAVITWVPVILLDPVTLKPLVKEETATTGG